MKDLLIFVAVVTFGSCILVGIFGGVAYVLFPREGDRSIITTCLELGGEPRWQKWENGCRGGKECYLETCIIQ